MIAYRGVAKDGTLTASANDSIIDDLSFRLAYKLSYDANGGAKKSTSQIKASTDGKVKTIAGKTDSLPTELVNGSGRPDRRWLHQIPVGRLDRRRPDQRQIRAAHRHR